MNNEIVVYWAPATFDPSAESWNFLYREPNPLFLDLAFMKSKNERSGNIFSCPASNNFFKNIFSVKSNLKDYFSFPEGFLEYTETIDVFPSDLDWIGNNVLLKKIRNSSYSGYADIYYNMQWIFFAEEPLTARFTPSYYPAKIPCEGALLASGEFDIGSWFRPYNLNYHIPIDAKTFSIDIDDSLFYIEFMTDKKIIFKRFNFTNSINALTNEFVSSPGRYGNFLPLYKRYEMAKKSKVLDIVLKEIKNNLVD